MKVGLVNGRGVGSGLLCPSLLDGKLYIDERSLWFMIHD